MSVKYSGKTMNRKRAKAIVNDLSDNVYGRQMYKKKWEIQFGRNPWLSLGFHIDHKDPSLTLHLPGIIIYCGYCKQPGYKFWNKMVPDAIEGETL